MLKATNLSTTGQTNVFQAVQETAITCMIFCNTSVTDCTITVWAVPNNAGALGSAGAANMILNTLTVTAADTFVMDMEKLVLAINDSIVVQASAANCINAVISTMSLT
jgi:hypothetical protein